jgi:hypothetical protein
MALCGEPPAAHTKADRYAQRPARSIDEAAHYTDGGPKIKRHHAPAVSIALDLQSRHSMTCGPYRDAGAGP